jgi:hypothetical protein
VRAQIQRQRIAQIADRRGRRIEQQQELAAVVAMRAPTVWPLSG